MNGYVSQIKQVEQTEKNGYGKKWREASSCEPTCAPPDSVEPCPPSKCVEVVREKDSFSKLTWLLLGLSGLLFLGSVFSNLFAVWAIARSTETNNTSREVITTTSDTREIRVIEKNGYEGDEYYYYAPPARW